MSLRFKVFLSVGGTFLVLFFVVQMALTRLLENDFLTLEEEAVHENVSRVSSAFDNKINELVVKVSDWAQWDDTYVFVQDRNEEYIVTNLQDEALRLLQIRFLVITDVDGQIIFKKEIDENGNDIEFSPSFEAFIRNHSELTTHTYGTSVQAGLVRLPEGVIMNVAHAVTSSDGNAPVKGAIMFGLFADDALASKLAELTHLQVTLQSYPAVAEVPDFSWAAERLEEENQVLVAPPMETDSEVSGYILKKSIDGQKALIFRVDLERHLYRHGQESMKLFIAIMVGSSLFIGGVVLLLFERLVLRRLSLFGKRVDEVSEGKNLEAAIALPGHDEFSHLAERLNVMLQSLRDVELRRRESEGRFQTIADSAPVMIWMSDINKKNTYVNKVWLDFTGHSLAEETGRGWKKDVHPDDLEMTDKAYEAAFSEQKPFSVEYRLRRKDGTYGWVFSRAVPHFTPDNVFLGYVGSCVDITERKEAEQQRQSYVEEVENMNRLMVERELKMIELKEKIKRLESHGK